MATSGDDPTRPVGRPPSSDVVPPTEAIPTAVPVDTTGAGGPVLPGGPVGPDGPGPSDAAAERRRRRNLWLGSVAVVLAGIAVGIVLAIATDSGAKTVAKKAVSTSASSTTASSSTSTSSSSTSTSSSSTSSSTSTSSTTTTSTTQPAPVITSFNAPDTNDCNTDPHVTLTWSTQNATGVTISIDGGVSGSYPASGSASAPFACGSASHTYLLTTTGGGPATTASRTVKQSP